jgi:phage terminase small subunit
MQSEEGQTTKPRQRKLVSKKERHNARHTLTDNGLSMTQEAYCRARAMGMTPKEACVAAGTGVHQKTAQSWERENVAIQSRIQELTSMASKNAILKTGLDRQWVISRLMTVADRCMQNEEVLDKRGDPTGEYRFDSIGATRALELLGKTLNMFDGGKNPLDEAYDHLSDDDLARIAEDLARKTGLLADLARAQQEAGPKQALTLHALPQAAGVPREGGDAPRETVPSGEPAWQDVEFSVRDSDPSDGAVPGVVDGETME